MGIGRFITHTMFRRGAFDYGVVAVPGSQQFELPAGRVFLTYQESKECKIDGHEGALLDVRFAAPPALQVSVTPASGGPALAISPSLSTNTSTKKGLSRDAIGSVGPLQSFRDHSVPTQRPARGRSCETRYPA